MTPLPRPPEVLAAAQAADPTAPRLTTYDNTDGPTRGERIELSARVLATWVAKAANALQEEHDVGPGSTVGIVLPAHWRALVWMLATWSAGGTVVLGARAGDADIVVSDDPAVLTAATGERVLVTLAALARSASGPVPPGAMDEARDLSTFPDRFEAWAHATDDDLALVADDEETAYGSLATRLAPAEPLEDGDRVHTATADPLGLAGLALAAWAVDGSLVHSRGAAADAVQLPMRLATERVTASR